MLPAVLTWLLVVVAMLAAATGAFSPIFIGGPGGWSLLGVSLIVLFGIPIHFVLTRLKYVPIYRAWIVEPEGGPYQEWDAQTWHMLWPGMQMVADIPWGCDVVFRLFPNGTPSVVFRGRTTKSVVADATLQVANVRRINYGVSGGMGENKRLVTDLLQGAIQVYCRNVTVPEGLRDRGTDLAGTTHVLPHIAAIQNLGWNVASLVVRDIQ